MKYFLAKLIDSYYCTVRILPETFPTLQEARDYLTSQYPEGEIWRYAEGVRIYSMEGIVEYVESYTEYWDRDEDETLLKRFQEEV